MNGTKIVWVFLAKAAPISNVDGKIVLRQLLCRSSSRFAGIETFITSGAKPLRDRARNMPIGIVCYYDF
jgi:hypothetical protein